MFVRFFTSRQWLILSLTSLSLLLGLSLAACGASRSVTEATSTSPAPAAATSLAPTTTHASPQLPAGPGMGSSGAFVSVAPTYSNLVYATLSPAEKLDLYLPPGEGPFPVVVMIHGGAFMFGDKSDGGGLGGVDQLLTAGYAVASINYRLSGEAKFPAQIQDVKAAVRFLRANAALYHLNPEKFGAWGASAGGNLAALSGTTCGMAELEGADLGNADQSSCVQAVVDWFGPIDFLKMDDQFDGTGCPHTHNEANSPESQLVGAPIQTVPDLVWMTNPMNFIDTSDMPFLIQHGSADCNIPPVQGQLLAHALSAAIGEGKVTYTLIDGAGHGGPQFTTTDNLALVIAFLDKYLK